MMGSMPTGKLVGVWVGGLLALTALALLSVRLFVDPNAYRVSLQETVKHATGRNLLLRENLTLSVFPRIAFQLGPVMLGNPENPSAQPAQISAQRVVVRPKLWPLLRGRLEIARVEIAGLDVRLARDANGTAGWRGLLQHERDDGGLDIGAVQLPAVKLTNARLSLGPYTVQNLNLETAPFGDGIVPVSLHFEANRGVATEHVVVDAKFDVSQSSHDRYRLAALTLLGQGTVAGNGRPVRGNLSIGTLDVDLKAQTLALPAYELTLAGAHLTGSLAGVQIVDDPGWTGSVALSPLVVREFLPRWGLTNPVTRDERALSQIAASAVVSYHAAALAFDNLQVALDDTHMRGSIKIQDLATRTARWDVALDRIDLDRYWPAMANFSGAPGAVRNGSARPAAAFAINGRVTVGSLKIAALDLTHASADVSDESGLWRVSSQEAQLYGGRLEGEASYDRRAAIPVLRLDEHASGIDLSTFGPSGHKHVRLVGLGAVNVKVSAAGVDEDVFMRSLTGHLDTYVTQGALEGVDLSYEMARDQTPLNQQKNPVVNDTRRTPFDALTMSAQITDGVLLTQDLSVSSPRLRMNGRGQARLYGNRIDLELLAGAPSVTPNSAVQMPVSVSGTLLNPTILAGASAMAAAKNLKHTVIP
jgi:AsmA protein